MKILTRMGDSSTVEMTRDELRHDLEEGDEPIGVSEGDVEPDAATPDEDKGNPR